MAKQAELPGYERPKNAKLDGLTEAYLAASKTHGASTSALVAARAALNHGLLEAEENETLEKTANGDPVYVYQGGDDPLAVVLESSEKLKVAKLTDKNDPAAVLG